MKYIKLFLPFALILLAANLALRRFDSLCGGEPYNVSLEGARILRYRQLMQNPQFAQGAEILFVGTSRTMADYDPEIFAQTLSRELGLARVPAALNLGNLGNYPAQLEAYLKAGELRPKILILEFSPHIFTLEEDAQTPFRRYKAAVAPYELFVSGWATQALGLQNLSWAVSYEAAAILQPRLNRQTLCLRERLRAYRYGQRLKPNGQVWYRVYLPDSAAAELARRKGFAPVEYGAFEKIYLAGDFKETEWQAYQRIVAEVFANGGAVIIVRPPVAPELYALENRQKRILKTAAAFFAARGVPYLDLNPHAYRTLDMSHVDWYDTAKLSADLAARAAPYVAADSFAP